LVDELTAHPAGRSARDLVFTTVNGDVLRNRNARRSTALLRRSASPV
jgi:hypothetical protein